ncbi:zinc metalloproteinase nas-14-like [Toxorhynchites rutilus septentrionalis]|uniref:zinc metalloproteinase nas-14-like n=1 Tax=Toxorhynchites rutilus septentrionalis TaxID=329112 RepID=UPI00247A586A|nr:zinc metalloproteinase nas-14-like [Toxorhynchites rutilus septentrionalis]
MGTTLFYLVCIVPLMGIVRSAPTERSIEIQEPNTPSASPLEEAGFFEGDMLLTEPQQDIISSGRTALISPESRWPRNTVYYVFDDTLSSQQIIQIRQGLDYIENFSCIKFLPRTTQKDYVRVTGEYTGCWSFLGRRGGEQQLNLQPKGCMSRGTIIHEFLHVLGFVHMQSSPERGFYVTIVYDAIQGGKQSNFNLYQSKLVDNFGVPYDYDSVMHYSPTAFSKNGGHTIIPLEQGVTIGQRVGLSFKDIKRLNLHYPECHIQ